MKIVYLVIYLWQADQATHEGQPNTVVAMNGGASVHIEPMPSLAACEAVGRAVKDLADANHPRFAEHPYHHIANLSTPTAFRCVEASR